MSEADRLFEELGYEKWIDSRNIIHFIHKKKEKDFTFMNGNCYSIKRPTQKEQVAINKKVEELRMDMTEEEKNDLVERIANITGSSCSEVEMRLKSLENFGKKIEELKVE